MTHNEFAKSPSFRRTMAWLHTWLGLGFGWMLYFMFVTGTVGYVDTEIDRWMRPELPAANYPQPEVPSIHHALAHLRAQAPDARRWTIQLPVDRNEPYLRVSWQPQAGAPPQSAWLDPRTGARLHARETAGGQTLYQMHWRLHYLPVQLAELLIGLASMVLLLALVTGIVVHRRLFADFFTLRLGKGQRSWLDAHNLASVVSLPFQLMISYSGLIFLMFSLVPLVANAWYGLAPDAGRTFYGELFPPTASIGHAYRAAPQLQIDQIVADAQTRWRGVQISALDIQHPGDAHARISVIGNFATSVLRSSDMLVYDGVSGALLAEKHAWESAPRAFRDLMLGLHEGLFAGPVLRVLYLISGLLGAAMIATGMVLWTSKRRSRTERLDDQTDAGLVWMERLNVGAIVGLPGAIAAFLWINRLLPADLPERASYEVHGLFLVWLALFVHAAVTPPRRAWRTQALFAALAFGGLPLLNALTSSRHLINAVPAGDWAMVSVDLAALVVGSAFWLGAWALGRRAPSC